MSKYVSIEAVEWALGQLHNSCKSLFADFLILKREGLGISGPIVITSISTAPSATRLLHIERNTAQEADRSHCYYNPFANVSPWRHDEYPRSGTYTTIERSRPLHQMMDVRRAGGGIQIELKPDYIDHVQATFRIRAADPVAITPLAFAAWGARYDVLPDEFSEDDLIAKVFGEYNITEDEAHLLFSGRENGPEIFCETPFKPNALVQRLASAIEPAPQAAPEDATSLPDETTEEALPEDLVEFLRGTLLLPTSLLRQIVTLVRAGKHLILTGPPGTGKTTLAARLAEASQKAAAKYQLPSSNGCIFTTATADWSTFDTMGGYVPEPSGHGLKFHEGIFLEAISHNQWVVIDELNRSDADKAFGQFFTLLSGHDVRTPFRDGEQPVTLKFDQNAAASSKANGGGTYTLGADWRLLATMNTFDRNMLFQLSAAFVRRFAIVYVGIPHADELKEWIAQRDLAPDELTGISSLIDIVTAARPLGPAIWSDFADYLTARRADAGVGGQGAILEALTAFVLPQMDGLDPEPLATFKRSVLEMFTGQEEHRELSRVFGELF